MKRFLLAIVFILYWVSSAYAAGDEYRVGVDGLACPFCVYGVEKQLNKLEGIERMDTDIQDGQLVLFMQEGATLSEQSIREAVNRAGFTLRSFTQTDGTE